MCLQGCLLSFSTLSDWSWAHLYKQVMLPPSLTCEFLCLMVYISLGKGDSRNARGMLLFRLKPKSSEEQATATNNLTGRVENAPDFPLEGTSLLSSSPQRHKGCPAQHRGKSTYLGLKSGGWALRRYPSESRGAWLLPF